MTYKQHPIVMLSTNKASNLMLCGNDLLCCPTTQDNYNFVRTHGNVKEQHLYILSDDEIEEGDWFINLANNTINQATDWIYVSTCKKIIATTDTSLILHDNSKNNKCFGTQLSGKCSHVLPLIPTSFIQYFIEQYNKGNIITHVNIEYEEYTNNTLTGLDIDSMIYNLKINSDNTINIKTIKDSYSRDEVIKIVKKFFNEALIPGQDKWIEQNL